MSFYRFLTALLTPFIGLYLRFRLRRGKEEASRFKERLGYAAAPRPKGKLVWCHAASVGEMMSVVTLLQALLRRHKDWSVLLTTGTVASARLGAARLPEGVVHHYVPVDRVSCIRRFLDHWRPDLALWLESELWPNTLSALKEREIPAALLNGRMSEKSFSRWLFFKKLAAEMLDAFTLGLAQTEEDARRYAELGLKNVHAVGNLKYAADPLPCENEELELLRSAIGQRPVWLMSSTHSGEEEIALRVHKELARRRPELLTIIAPRHPQRGDEIAETIRSSGCSFARRSEREKIGQKTSVYLADTMGELGLFYRLARHVVLAGSFTWGGHNPVEPAQLGCAILFGPRIHNFALMCADMLANHAALQVADEKDLVRQLENLLDSQEESETLATASRKWAESKRSILDATLSRLDPFFIALPKAAT